MNTEASQLESYNNEEIDLRELFSILWKGKWWIICITFTFAVASVAIALYLPNEYRATVVVQPKDSSSSGKLSSLAGQFGGLASLAGINLGAGQSSEATIAMEIMKSWGFAENFINKHGLEPSLFAAIDWKQSDNKLIYDSKLYDKETMQWVKALPDNGKSMEPTSWKLYKRYKEVFSTSQDKDTGLISISATHYSPVLAKTWCELLVKDINEYMKQRALEESNQSIQYLKEQISVTNVAEIRSVFAQLIQEQYKTQMLAQVSDEFVYKTISVAKVPEEKVKPKRALIVLLGAFLGMVVSFCVVFILTVFRKS